MRILGNPKKRIRRHVTLIEVLIAMTLTVLVLTTLMFFYRQISTIGSEIDLLKAEHFKLRYLENRLSEIFPRVIRENDKKKDSVFFSIEEEGPAKQSLIFTFDNDVDLDPVFSNHVLGRLYLDQEGSRLSLAYWPSPKRWEGGGQIPMKREILLEGVGSLAFEFFIPPDREDEEKKTNPAQNPEPNAKETPQAAPQPEPKGDWRKLPWLKEYEKLPAMVRVIVVMKGENVPMEFVFPLSNSKNHIVIE